MQRMNSIAVLNGHSCKPIWKFIFLVYWDTRNSLLYNLIISFIDGVTFVVISATQSFHRCYLQNVADISYAAITKCHFWSDFSKFWIENVHTSVVEVIGGHRGSKRRSKTQRPALCTLRVFEANIIQKFKKTLAMEIGYPKDRKGLLIGISFVTMYCALLYKDRLTEHFPAYMVLNFQKVIKRLAYQIRIQGPVIQANGRLTFGNDLRSGGLLYFTVPTELADSMVTLGDPRGG